MYNPQEMLEDLPNLQQELQRLGAHLANECDEITEQWDALGRMGARRADAAAGLLSKLRPHLEGIQYFCRDCIEQIDVMKADPFQRNTPE